MTCDTPGRMKAAGIRRIAAGGVALALLLAACGGEDPTPASDRARVASPEVTPFPSLAASKSPTATERDEGKSAVEKRGRTAAILVDRPGPNQAVTSPVTVAGTANVFEATVSVRILTADGRKLAEKFTTATCGSGCRGDFSVDVPFEVMAPEKGIIMVYEASAETGRPINVVRVPVTLQP